jgi:hypothetical protein
LSGISGKSQDSLIITISIFNSINFAFNKSILLQILLALLKKTFSLFADLFVDPFVLKNHCFVSENCYHKLSDIAVDWDCCQSRGYCMGSVECRHSFVVEIHSFNYKAYKGWGIVVLTDIVVYVRTYYNFCYIYFGDSDFGFCRFDDIFCFGDDSDKYFLYCYWDLMLFQCESVYDLFRFWNPNLY